MNIAGSSGGSSALFPHNLVRGDHMIRPYFESRIATKELFSEFALAR